MRDSFGRFVKGSTFGFQKGNTYGALTKGKILSQETKSKISKSRRGKGTGVKNYKWNGGTTIDKDGYIRVRRPEHPFSDKRGYILQHRLVMENKLGRYLQSEEDVHHIDHDRQNNNILNLILFANRSEHVKYHCKERGNYK